ncbi:MAG: DUF4307 domain-containing protein [Propioniciclava sp.]
MTSPSDAERIAQRYPRSRAPGWLWLVGVAIVLAIGVPWLLWAALQGANPAISAKLVTFTVTSDTTVDVLITVQRPDPSVPGVCTLRAQAVGTDTVGQLDVVVEPGPDELTDHEVTIRTFKPATSASVIGCHATG